MYRNKLVTTLLSKRAVQAVVDVMRKRWWLVEW